MLFFSRNAYYTYTRTDKTVRRKGGKVMGVEERIAMLEEENKQLKNDKQTLLLIIDQMRVTLNRLIERSIKK